MAGKGNTDTERRMSTGLQSTRNNWVKWCRRHLGDSVKNLRRQIRRGIRHPKLAWDYQAFRRAVERRDWEDAHRRLGPLAEGSERARDTRLLGEMGLAAERLGEYEKSTQCHVACARIEGKGSPDEWDGCDISDATLVIRFMESEKQGLAVGLNLAGFVAQAAQKAAQCVLVVERRLVPVFQRTLPNVRTLAYPASYEAPPNERVVTANHLTLKSVLGSAPAAIEERFLPLQADAGRAAELKSRYLNGRSKPLIGISWWSSHFGKDLPSIDDWAEFVRSTDAIFINAQYGNVSEDLAALERAAPGRLINDTGIDQLSDMDGFAAQLAALDGMITISNTGAHLAGAMGLPLCLIRDDWFRRAWPVRSHRVPWYPSATVIGKEGRPWPEAMIRVGKWLGGIGSLSPTSQSA